MNSGVEFVEFVERDFQKFFVKIDGKEKVRYSREPRTPKKWEKTQPELR